MINIIDSLNRIMEEGRDAVITVIVDSKGSIPRGAGAYMLVDETGIVDGSVGGGALEYKVIQRAHKVLDNKKSEAVHYDLTDNGAELGMVCGGHLDIIFVYCAGNNAGIKDFVEQCKQHNTHSDRFCVAFPVDGTAPYIAKHIFEQPIHREVSDGIYYEEFNYDGMVYIMGAGHLAKELVPVLTHLDFKCVIVDDREDLFNADAFCEARERICTDFSCIGEIIAVTDKDYIVIVTRGHSCDTEAEAFALNTKAKYIGVVGSKKKTAYVNSELIKRGFTMDDIQRVHAPIGIPIGSETPAEIAISIAAEMISVRREG